MSESKTVKLECPIQGCQWQYNSGFNADQSFQIINMHVERDHAPQQQRQVAPTKAPKLIPPRIDVGIDQEAWAAFSLRWRQYCQGSNISPEIQSIQLFQCASETLGNLLLKANPNITDCTPEVVLQSLERFAVIQTAKSVLRAELMRMSQANDEPIRTFSARVQGKAQTCGFTTLHTCKCGEQEEVDYTQDVIKDVVLAGIGDPEIQTSVLDCDGIEEKTLNEVISLIERKEKSRKAYSIASSSVTALSSFKRQQHQPSTNSSNQHNKPLPSPKIPCPRCRKPFQVYNGRNIKPFKFCLSCFRDSRGSTKKRDNPPSAFAVNAVDEGAILIQKASLQDNVTSNCGFSVNSVHKEDALQRSPLDDATPAPSFSHVGVSAVTSRPHPKLNLRLRQIGGDRIVSLVGIADTGAQTNIWGLADYIRAGFKKEMLQKPTVRVHAVNQNKLRIIGGFVAEMEGDDPNGKKVNCRAMVQVSDSISGFFISQDTLILLGVINENFPVVGSSPSVGIGTVSTKLTDMPASVCELHFCECPQRSAVPSRPNKLPFAPVPANIGKMSKWLLDFFKSSTFNICPHKPLYEMSGPPLEIHISESAQPRVCHTPAPIPLHWQGQVEADLKRDEALGILERVPFGVPVTWCHRMVVTRKHDGTPRRTVDLSPLNKYCKRETHSAGSPFHLARRIPCNTWKTVTDAWNGYHSVPLRPSDRHLTTFITPFGRWRYTRAPQGFLSSGDGYNRRFEAVLEGFERKERCVDDTIHYDQNLEEHWWRTIDFLILVGQAGIVLNPKKFQFAQKEVEFAGFKVCSSTVEPLPKYLDAVKTFPTPKSYIDIKSWFGLVNQLSSYSQLRDVMAPFRTFLSPKVVFRWDAELNEAFERSKAHIIALIKKGVQIFETNRLTCLRPDWSKQGIGYFLMQKHCTCASKLPDCCDKGWKVTLAGSRFLSDTESRYAAVEGEALAIAWGLEQSRYFTQGCDNLVVVTDHKPLVKVFGDRTLDEITNTRLFRLKQRTLPWYFSVAYLPGKTNTAADAASRHPCPNSLAVSQMSIDDISEHLTMAAISREATELTSISWDTLSEETKLCPTLSQLLRAIQQNFRGEYDGISEYMRYKDSLFVQGGVVLYHDRAVIPRSLRASVLDTLHSAHQGVSSMQQRAQAIVFWPGMTRDIENKRKCCSDCNRNAPSQAILPTVPASPPSSPFESIYADFFDFGGHHYLVAGDRLSGFSEIFQTPTGTSNAGSFGLIKCLRKWFGTFGVPRELSSDGGPEFAADATARFLESWGVNHRQSSAYHPQSNGRAEVAVKTVKRLLRSNIGPGGSLNTDKFLRALLQLRNTPDPDCGVSPSEIVFGRRLRDNLLFTEYIDRRQYAKRWQSAWAAKEDALRARFVRTAENINQRSRHLSPLNLGDKCFIQDQTGKLAKTWHCTGTVVDVLPYHKYTIRIDGSGRLTNRNRQFLRRYEPARMTINTSHPPCVAPPEVPKIIPRRVYDDVPTSTSRDIDVPIEGRSLPSHESDSKSFVEPVEAEQAVPTEVRGKESREATVKPSTARPPLALRRLLNYNKPGLKEASRSSDN